MTTDAGALSPVQMTDGLSTDPIPTVDVRALARRAAVPAGLVAVVASVLILAGGPLEAFADATRRAVEADPGWVAAAAGFELLSFVGYVALLWLVAGRATPRIGLRESTQITLGGAAATRLLPTAGAGGAALTLWSLRRSGLGTGGAARTLMAFLVVLYAVFLGAILISGGALAVGLASSDAPLALTALPALAAALAIATAVALGVARPDDAAAPSRMRRAGRLVGAGVRDAIAVIRSRDVRLVGAVAWWAFDAAVLWAMLHAFGTPPSLAVIVLGYFVGQVGNTLPIPGAVSGGMVGVLLAAGVPADLAVVSVLAYRSVAIWIPAPVGLAALPGLRATLARWDREESAMSASAEETVEEPQPVELPAPVEPPVYLPTGRPATSRSRARRGPCSEPALQGVAA